MSLPEFIKDNNSEFYANKDDINKDKILSKLTKDILDK